MYDEKRRKEFFTMYVAAENSIHRFLQLLVHDDRVFDDVCQNVALRLWELFDTYDATRRFDVWARGVTVKVVNELRRSERRFARVLPPEAVAAIADGYENDPYHAVEPSKELEALKRCLEALPAPSRVLISKRYFEALSIEETAQQTSRSVHATYKALERALQMLSECVHQRLVTFVPSENR